MSTTSGAPAMVVIAGLPRSGTTLLAGLLAAHDRCTFITDYMPAFTNARANLGVDWNQGLNLSQRKVSLALVRDQLLRMGQLSLIGTEDFSTLAGLHRRLLADWAQPGDQLVGHKLLLGATEIRRLLEQSNLHAILLIRDPRDSALSFYHRTGGGVESYLRRWRATVRFGQHYAHPRLHVLSYEQMVQGGYGYLSPRLTALGLGHDESPPLRPLFVRGNGSSMQWPGNSSIDPSPEPDAGQGFDESRLERWRNHADSPIVRYASWFCSDEIATLGYRQDPSRNAREAVRWATHGALHNALDKADSFSRKLRRRLISMAAPPLRP